MTNQLFREVLDGRIPLPAKPSPPTLADVFDSAWKNITDSFQNVLEAFQPLMESLQESGLIATAPPTDPREFALWNIKNRNTGPALDNLAKRGRVTHYKTK